MSGWSGRRVFVTGGNGFLGAHVVRGLLDGGAEVTCLLKEERLGSLFYTDGTAGRVRRVPGALEDFSLLCDVFRQMDTVFHLAAQPIVGEARENPFPALEANVRGTYNLLEAARRASLRAIVVVSSDKVYGEAEHLPYREHDALLGRDLYDASKVCADVMAQSYARTFDLPIGIARPGNLYGPGDIQWSRVIPAAACALLRGERPVIRSDGSPRRDYFYVEDAAGALLALGLALDRSEVQGEAFNFGTGVPTTVLEVVRMLTQRAGGHFEPVVQGVARGEIQAQYLDCSKARRLLDWAPRTALAVGLDFTWAWYERFFREHLA